ncbi:nitrile hydratase subunit beta [soil metagenome]
MNGAHDVGGMHGFGALPPEQPEPFRQDWERLTFALMITLTGHTQLWSDNENRHAVETMGNLDYLTASYFERWLHAIETLTVRRGLFTRSELIERAELLAAGQYSTPRPSTDSVLTEQILSSVRQRNDGRQSSTREPRFASGNYVITTRESPEGHTRLPRYARGCIGTIFAFRGIHTFPDTEAMGNGEHPQPLYTVRFEASDLWGTTTRTRDAVMVDLWEDHLHPANETSQTR